MPVSAQVRFDADGSDRLETVHALIGQARHTLEVCTFVWGRDPVADGIAQALLSAAGRGVQVRILVDGIGTPGSRPDLQAANLHWRRSRPLFGNHEHAPLNLRNHRKLIVADNASLWSGGRNLASTYFLPDSHDDGWCDLSFRIDGILAAQARALFDCDWARADGQAVQPWQPCSGELDGHGVQWLPSGPDMAEDTVAAWLLAACLHAEQRLWAVTPYFIPDPALVSALKVAARQGVDVRILVPMRSNHRMADFVRPRAIRELQQAGVQFLLHPRMVHAKAVIVDQGPAWCGSVNLDPRSLYLNREAVAVFHDPDHAQWLDGWFLRQFRTASIYRPDAPGFWRDLGEGALQVFGFQL